jgi:hypothetical protein
MDLELHQPSAEPVNRAPSPDDTTPRKTPIMTIAIAGLALGGALAWWWAADRGAAPSTVAAVSATEAALPVTADPAKPLPPLGQMDIFLRGLLGTLSSHPEFVRWLATDDLIRQMARAIDQVSRGESPADTLSVLTPQQPFDIAGRRGDYSIDPVSFRRYEPIAGAVASLDAEGVARAYRTIQPRLDEAYRALGRAEGGVDTAVQVALQTLIATPVASEPIPVVPGRGATYAYANGAFEKLSPAQKQLVRMGPSNQRRVQAKLREISKAIDASTAR